MLLHLLAFLLFQTTPQTIQIRHDKPDGVYQEGNSVTWNIEVPGRTGKVTTVVKVGGLEATQKSEIELVDGKGQVTSTRTSAGALLLEVRYKVEGKELVAHSGVVFSPDKIKASLPEPKDFDDFWKAKIKELNEVPMNVQLEKVDINDPTVEYWKITMDNIRGSKIYGQIAKPTGKTGLPAMLQVQWAGVYPLHRDWVVGNARQGWISMNIMAHDLPFDKPQAFYQEKANGDLKDYTAIGAEDKEASYFLRMFLSCRRAVDYLLTRDDWNKKTLLVHGGSQGGYQAIVTAGIHPSVTAFAANVPAGCDLTGTRANRAPGWPDWTGRAWLKRDPVKLEQTARYFDAANFARRVKVPGLIGIGLKDTVCPAEGIFATANLLKGQKIVVILPNAGHGDENGSHAPYYKAFNSFVAEQKK